MGPGMLPSSSDPESELLSHWGKLSNAKLVVRLTCTTNQFISHPHQLIGILGIEGQGLDPPNGPRETAHIFCGHVISSKVIHAHKLACHNNMYIMLLLDQPAFTCSPAHLGLGRAVKSRQNPRPQGGAAAQRENTNPLKSKRTLSLSAGRVNGALGTVSAPGEKSLSPVKCFFR